jgi:hypothetical protein
MTVRRIARRRAGRFSHDFIMMLMMMIVVCIAVTSFLAPDQGNDPRPLWERIIASLLGLLQCFGVGIGFFMILASWEMMKHTALRYRQRRVAARKGRLEPLMRDAHRRATPANLALALGLLNDPDPTIRRHAFAAAFTLLRARPDLWANPYSDPRTLWQRFSTRLLRARHGDGSAGSPIEQALLGEPGFAQTLAECPDDRLLERVTLGAKLGAGTADKRMAPATSCADELARWVEVHRRDQDNLEIQVSIGYDTGSLPFLGERGRFLALYLFIATTDLGRFQALVRRPARDPNAAYGLLIRGDVVEVRFPGQARGHRLDYVFPLPNRLSTTNLAGLFRDLQLLNLGLLIASAVDAWRVLLPGSTPSWLDARRRALADQYRLFERRLVALLRRHDVHREPDCIHPLVPSDHVERIRAFGQYRLEECLYPQYSWVVPLYDADTRWDRLLAPLRCIEGMLLHQGASDDGETTQGAAFIHEVRRLGYETARALEEMLQAAEPPTLPVQPPDPFLDQAEEEANRHYLTRVNQAIALGQACPEDVPDPVTFRQATAYYGVATEFPPVPRTPVPPEMEP